MNSIELNHISKKYRNKLALNDISISIKNNSVIGVLGRNGAGKSTMNKIITGLTFPTAGEALIYGEKARCGLGKISFLSENIAIYQNMNAIDNLKQIYYSENMKPDIDKINRILRRLALENAKGDSKDFSLGMKRRLQIAMSFLINPKEIIIMDEPTTGLDINGVLWLKEEIRKLKQAGHTILVTSHAIAELEEVLDGYFFLGEGKIVKQGKIDNSDTFEFTFDMTQVSSAVEVLTNIKCDIINVNNNTIELSGEQMNMADYIRLFYDSQIVPIDVRNRKQSLVTEFNNLFGEETEDEGSIC